MNDCHIEQNLLSLNYSLNVNVNCDNKSLQKLLQFTYPPSWNSDVTWLVNLTRETVLRGSIDPVGLASQTTQRSSDARSTMVKSSRF